MSPTTTNIVTADQRGSKFVLAASSYEEEQAEFIASLPLGKWDRKLIAYTCDATPAAAYRISLREDFAVDGTIRSIAERFSRRLESISNEQPVIRRHDAWPHQAWAYHWSYNNDASIANVCMGGGKSKITIDLIQNKQFWSTLILCPTQVRAVWPKEIVKHGAIDVKVVVLESGTTITKARQIKENMEFVTRGITPVVFVLNYESCWREPLASEILGIQWDAVILDESHRIKSHDSNVSKFCAKLSKRAAFRLCLTGTMMSVPSDVFGQYRFLDPGVFGTSFHRFQARYAVMNRYIPHKVDQWVNQDEFAERVGWLAYRVGPEVLKDLPDAQHIQRPVVLSPKAMKFYQTLEKQMIAEIDGGTITAANGLVKLLRLQQATSGFMVEDETGNVIEIDTSKADMLTEILEDIGNEPVVVVCKFKHDLATIEAVCQKLGKSYGEISGARKDGLTNQATMNPDIDVLGAQIQSGGVGIDLTRARYAVCYSVGFDLINYEQFLARIHRPGQTRDCTYFHLCAEKTVDHVVYGALKNKQNVIDSILSNLRGSR